ncbi:hypothetical protein SDC9_44613 [bioreactor metagenome]|uniref:Molybdopterin dinucleotide-binding domain-containing protein n=2 Tax=root TaxID=1 RepID=A0A644W497_9ZZZZ
MDNDEISFVHMNEKMANELFIKANEIISLKNKNGEIKAKLKIDNSVADFVVLMYAGWWTKHGNPNYLTNSGISDIGGQVTYNETVVEIIT